MLSLFSKRRKTAEAKDVFLTHGERVYCIGDIHGRADLFDDLVELIQIDDRARTPARTRIVLLGDLVDRGPDSAGVIDRAIALQDRYKVDLLSANHEEVFLKALTGSVEALRYMIQIGGAPTILSYPIARDEFDRLDYDELSRRLCEIVPQSHVAFLGQARDYLQIGDYLFVHAGIRPGVPLENQRGSDLRWIREPFLGSTRDHGVMVVHGHSITEEVDERPNRIGIDTGAYRSGILTALCLEGAERWYLATAGETAEFD